MKTLISSTEDSATYEFTFGDATRVVEYNKPQPPASNEQTTDQPFDHETMSENEYSSWLLWLGASE